MDNTPTSIKLQLRVVDPTFCPSGTSISDILNAYQEQYLKTATILIPGLSSLDVNSIASILTNIQELQALYAAINKATRNGEVTPSTEDELITVQIVPNMPTNDYSVYLTITSPSGAAVETDFFGVTLERLSKTVTSFQIQCHNIPSGYRVEWAVRQN